MECAYDETRPAYTLECYRVLQQYGVKLHCKVQGYAMYLAPSPQQEYLVSIYAFRLCRCLQANVNNHLVPGNASLPICVTQPTQMQSACLGSHGKLLKIGSRATARECRSLWHHGKLLKIGSPATARECRSVWQDSRSKKRRLLSRFALRMLG